MSAPSLREEMERIEALYAKATPGEWAADPKRLVVGGQQGPIMCYLVGNSAMPERMKVSLASERIADHHLTAALHNAFPTLRTAALRSVELEGALELARSAVHYNGEGSPTVDRAIWELFDVTARRLLSTRVEEAKNES